MYNVSYEHKEKSLFYYLFLTLQHYTLFPTLQHFSLFFSMCDSHVERCAAVIRNPVAHRLLIGRQLLRGSHVGHCAAVTWGVARQSRGALRGSRAAVTWGVARQSRGALRGRCAAVLRNPVATAF